jgi:hypothetical protein
MAYRTQSATHVVSLVNGYTFFHCQKSVFQEVCTEGDVWRRHCVCTLICRSRLTRASKIGVQEDPVEQTSFCFQFHLTNVGFRAVSRLSAAAVGDTFGFAHLVNGFALLCSV